MKSLVYFTETIGSWCVFKLLSCKTRAINISVSFGDEEPTKGKDFCP